MKNLFAEYLIKINFTVKIDKKSIWNLKIE